jgi:phosphohistidine swiveling domain-containing protein
MWSLKDSPYTQDQFESQIDDIVQNVAEPNISRLQSIKLQKKRKQELEKVLGSIKADRVLWDQVFLLQEYMQLRTTRRLALTKAHYNLLPVLAQASRYLQLEGEDICDLSLGEIVDGLHGEKPVSELQELVRARRDGWGILVLEGQIQQIDGAKKVVETILAHQIIDTNTPKAPMVVTGRTACSGRAVGVVRVVHDFKELGSVQAGDILVTKMTTPEFVPAMNRAAGVVTDEGGATCHAAIVSREFGLPCIAGTGNATVVLHDGDTVELDADRGVVRIQSKGMVRRSDKIIGKSGFNGQVTGKVTKLRDISDAERIESGDIIITSEVTPMYLSFLYKVGGMIVEEGSLTSHARLYANALKIPTLVGIEGAMDTFDDGDEIVLDSEKGYAKRV